MYFLVLVLAFSAASAVPTGQARIAGGTVTSINYYPHAAALLYSWNGLVYWQQCGGIILSARSILSAAHCSFGDAVFRWRVRVGSTWANSGGSVYSFISYTIHPDYNPITLDSDIVIMRTISAIVFSDVVQRALIASSTYHVADNQPVWAVGWGAIDNFGTPSEQLRHVQLWKINQSVCRSRYGPFLTANMLCAGWVGVGGRDQCQGDTGGALYHNDIVIGVCSWNLSCGESDYPGVNVRVSRFSNWIQSNA